MPNLTPNAIPKMLKKLPLLTLTTLVLFNLGACAQKQKVWLDADTGNEIDDLYAIVQLLASDKVEVVGLSSAHFNNTDLLVVEKWNGYDTKGLNTVAESQKLNEELLAVMGKTDIPHPMGANRIMGRAWGGSEPRASAATEGLIAAAKALPEGEKLDVLTLGAMTNVASALAIAPEIADKIRFYALGSHYYADKKAWHKGEFNTRNDINAFDYLLDLEALDFTLMPVEAALPLRFKRTETFQKLDEGITLEAILENRWKEHAKGDEERIMWDLALVLAYLHPEWATVETVAAPRANKRDSLPIYSEIDAASMEAFFWKTVEGLR